MQDRIFNYADDDLTFRLNERLLGVLDPGVYRGFKLTDGGLMVLTLDHSVTGATTVGLAKTITSDVGVLVTRQGAIIRETADVNLNVTANSSGNPRIDLVIMTHEYVAAVGGIVAVYSIIEGTPAATPTIPSLTDLSTQIAIGTMTIPDGTTTVLTAVTFYNYPVNDFAGDATIAHTDTEQTFTEIQEFAKGTSVGSSYPTITLDASSSGTGNIKPTDGELHPIYVCDLASNQWVTKFVGAFLTAPVGWSCLILFRGQHRISGTNVNGDGDLFLGGYGTGVVNNREILQLQNNEIVKFTKVNGATLGYAMIEANWYVEAPATRQGVNDFRGMQMFNKNVTAIHVVSFNDIILPITGNFHDMYADDNYFPVNSMTATKEADRGGTHIWLRITGTRSFIIQHTNYTPTGGMKAINTLTEENYTVLPGTILHFIEFESAWLLIAKYSADDGYVDAIAPTYDGHEYFGDTLTPLDAGWSATASKAMIDKDQVDRVYVSAEIVYGGGGTLSVSITSTPIASNTICTLPSTLWPNSPFGKAVWYFPCLVIDDGSRIIIGITAAGELFIVLGAISNGYTLSMEFSYISIE